LRMLSGIPDHYHIVLASRSPRRKQLLTEAGLKFDVIIKDFTEDYPAGLRGNEIAEYLAREKAFTFKGNIADQELIITADTIVWCDNMVLDKPSDYMGAFDILSILSGNTHEVITGVSFISNRQEHTFSEKTKVTFDTLTAEEIDFYIRNYKPFDKAGAYGIQEWIGIVANSRIEGSYFNVMGLPVHRLIKELRKFIQNNDSIQT
jgi:septum formation protein